MHQQSMVGRLGVIIGFGGLAADAGFGLQLHDRLKEVREQAEDTVQFGEDEQLGIGIKASVADGFADDRVVLLFDEATVIFAIGAAAGESNLVIETVLEEFGVNKLTAVVRVNALKGKRELGTDISKGLQDPPAGFGLQCPCFGPTRCHIGHVKGMDDIRARNAAIMSHEVNFDKAGELLIPLGEGADGDLMLQ